MRFIGTSNRGFAQQAQEEIRRLIKEVKFTYLIPSEVFLIEFTNIENQFLKLIREQKPIFLRHIQPVDISFPVTRSDSDLQQMVEYIKQVTLTAEEKVALQIRKTPHISFEYSPVEIKTTLDPIFNEIHQIELVTRHADKVISIFLSENIMYLGISNPEDNLSDWSGGAIRFRKEEGQISRAKFKLLEAEEEFNLDFTQFKHALDIGAAPGGWTSLLLEKDLQVTAVDPAQLHPSLLQHPKLTFLQKNASDVSFSPAEFDLLVCDMSWSPRQMSKLIYDLLPALKRHGTAIITAKLMHKKPFQTVKEICELLEPLLELNRAKQLFHNREELTLHFTKK